MTGITRLEPAGRWRMGYASLFLLLIASCAVTTPGRGGLENLPGTDAETCPAVAVQPADDRPVIDLRFELADDRRTVSGSETVRFTPDRTTDEMVFRLTPNQPSSVAAGSGIEVGEVTGDDVSFTGFELAGADESTQGGLLVLGLRRALQPGESTEVVIDFRLRLGSGSFDRFGQDAQTSWWGSGHPLLAWEPGGGWRREPLVDVLGETATSPAASTTLTVLAPPDRTVLMTGGAVRLEDDGRRALWRSSSHAARDVSVAVGDFTTAQMSLDGTTVITGAADEDAAAELLERIGDVVVGMEQYFGEFPFETLSVVRLEDYGGGIEYPAMILLADGGDVTLAHEIAHMWFYGMVGNDQARDPWLDETFAAYAEALVNGPPEEPRQAPGGPLAVGLPISAFPDDKAYFETVYDNGAAMLDRAREESGPEKFDAALRCYLNANAWRIAAPKDVETALRDLPAALAVLREAGAL